MMILKISKKLLKWNDREKLYFNTNKLEVSYTNNITVDVEVRTPYKKNLSLSKEDINFLKALNFIEKDPDTKYRIFVKKMKLKGKRFLPKPRLSYKTTSSFNKSHNITVYYCDPSKEMLKVAFTPLTVTKDAAVVAIGSAGLVVFYSVIGSANIMTCVTNSRYSCKKNPFKMDWR